MQVDTTLSFLDDFVASALSKGARSYVSEKERLGMGGFMSIANDHGPATQSLRFDAYEKPRLPTVNAGPPSSISVLEPENRRTEQSSLVPVAAPSAAGADPSALDGSRLRLDGVQKKWGRQVYSPSLPSDRDRAPSNGSSFKETSNAPARRESSTSSTSRTEGNRTKEPAVSVEKQKLAASLFGISSKSDRLDQRGKNTGCTKSSKSSGRKGQPSRPSTAADYSHRPASTGGRESVGHSDTQVTAATSAPADLLDMSDGPLVTLSGSAVTKPFHDPLKELEGLLDVDTPGVAAKAGVPDKPTLDLLSLYGETVSGGNGVSYLGLDLVTSSGLGGNAAVPEVVPGLLDAAGPLAENSVGSFHASTAPIVSKKGYSQQGAVQRDAASRQVGVTPSSPNPGLFRDLLN